MQPGHELFDHTADLGIRVWAPTLAGLLLPAARGLYEAIGDVIAGAGEVSAEFDLQASEAALLLRDYLAELLRWFEISSRVLVDLSVAQFDEHRLAATARLGDLDRERSCLVREVKAITYHDLTVTPVAGGFEATLIVDI